MDIKGLDMKLFLDLDDVLVDFVGGACRLWGVSSPGLIEPHWQPGVWSCVKPLSDYLISRGMLPDWINPEEGLTDNHFWSRINGDEEFWAGLPDLPWAPNLFDLAKDRGLEWYILTSPGWCASGYSGKVKWGKRRFGDRFDRLIPTPHKHLFANPESILIDDSDINCQRFREAGGHAIVFPRIHNQLHEHRADPIGCVTQSLNDLLERNDSTNPYLIRRTQPCT